MYQRNAEEHMILVFWNKSFSKNPYLDVQGVYSSYNTTVIYHTFLATPNYVCRIFKTILFFTFSNNFQYLIFHSYCDYYNYSNDVIDMLYCHV